MSGWMPDSPLLTVSETARMLRVSESALREWMHHRRDGQPRVPHIRLGRRVLIPREWVDGVIASAGSTQPPGGGPRAA
jgi:excisionase family DNA binding protein